MSLFDIYPEPTRANFLPVTEQESAWGLYLTGAGYDDMRPGRSFVNEGRPELYRLEQNCKRILPEYVFIYIAEGAGIYISDDGGSIPVEKGTLLILFPGTGHQLLPDKKIGWKDIWITANGPYIHSLTQNGILNPQKPVIFESDSSSKPSNRIEKLCEQVLENPQINSTKYTSELLALLIEIAQHESNRNTSLLTISESNSNSKTGEKTAPTPSDSARIVQKACQEIWNWGYREIDIKKLAKNMGVTRRSLERYFQKELNRTIREEIHRCRLYRAINLLQQTNIRIEQVALMAGFPSYTHMIRVFKRILGKIPGEYRQ